MEPTVIHGPTADTLTGAPASVIYNITLASGVVITSPAGFGEREDDGLHAASGVYVSEGGRVLMPEPQEPPK